MNSTHKTRTHICKDGSHTLYSEKFQQYYHNPNGAIAESQHVFFKTPDLINRIREKPSFHLFEVGFGTGLNLLLLLEHLKKLEKVPPINYKSIEAYPLSLRQAMKLNYPRKLELRNASEILACIFRDLKPGYNVINVHKNVTLELFSGSFEQLPEPGQPCDMIFFDPFSPDVNPELWRDEIFRKLASWSNSDVLLSTYGAASRARAAMAAAGWKIARAPGALGKREMTIAALDSAKLSGWKKIDEEKLADRYRNGEFDQ